MVKILESFKLSETEGGEVELILEDISKSKEVCENSLVGKIYGDNGVNYTSLRQTMEKLWCAEGSLKVIKMKNKMYQFIFSKAGEKCRVLNKRPWTFDNQLLVIEP